MTRPHIAAATALRGILEEYSTFLQQSDKSKQKNAMKQAASLGFALKCGALRDFCDVRFLLKMIMRLITCKCGKAARVEWCHHEISITRRWSVYSGGSLVVAFLNLRSAAVTLGTNIL